MERYDENGDSDPADDTFVIEYAFGPAGGSFGAPQVISGNTGEGPDRPATA
jgi:hypothetical protein